MTPHRQASANPVGTAQASVTMSAEAGGTAKRVLVTGAGGRTGGIVFEKLLKKEGYATRGMVRSQKVTARFIRTYTCLLVRPRLDRWRWAVRALSRAFPVNPFRTVVATVLGAHNLESVWDDFCCKDRARCQLVGPSLARRR